VQGLWQLEIPTFEPGPATCPRCADGTPLYAPGSTGTAAEPMPAPSGRSSSDILAELRER
jgi:hypothetical protein